MTKSTLLKRYEESHENREKASKLAHYFVQPHQKMTSGMRKGLADLIASSSKESGIQKFTEKYPYVITEKIYPAHHGQLCIPKPNLGGQLHPDFLIAGLDSAGWWWYGVELENPKYKMFTNSGDPSKELSHAMRQITDWRQWLIDNIGFARDTLGYIQIDGDLPCYILIGRRDNEELDGIQLQRQQRGIMKRDKDSLFLHHYEWLLDESPTLINIKSGKYLYTI